MFMFCKVNFHVERSASRFFVHWVYILVIRSPVVLRPGAYSDIRLWSFAVNVLLLYKRKGTLLKFHCRRALSRQERTKTSLEKRFLFFHKSMRSFTVKETLFIKDEALLTIFSSAHDRMIPFP